MIRLTKLAKTIAAGAIAALALSPLALSAQADLRSSPVQSYHLVQLSVERTAIGLEEFDAKTRAIRSCSDAGDLAQELGADFTRNRFIRASEMPQQLQDILADLPAGQATPVFSNNASDMRVLVVCNRA